MKISLVNQKVDLKKVVILENQLIFQKVLERKQVSSNQFGSQNR